MLGNRKANIKLVNQLFETQNFVDFVIVSDSLIEQLFERFKQLKIEARISFEQDPLLMYEVDLFIRTFKRLAGVLEDYSSYIQSNEQSIVRFFQFITSINSYQDIFGTHVKPILDILKKLKYDNRNAYLEKLEEILIEAHEDKDIVVIARYPLRQKFLQIAGHKIRIFRASEFINMGIFVDEIYFIGTPSYYEKKFSEIFYSKNTFFIGYSCFENKILKSNSFEKLISKNEIINTIYKNVSLGKGFNGINYTIDIKPKLELIKGKNVIDEEDKNGSDLLVDKVAAKQVVISNKCWIYVPLNQKINLLDRESMKVTHVNAKNLSIGDLLVFRSHNASTLIREVADQIIGVEAAGYRENIEKWKNKLRKNIKNKGIKNVSLILTKRYGIASATENNIKNWISPYSIMPKKNFDKLLDAFKFNDKEKNKIKKSAKKLISAHIAAGHKISQSLMNEINTSLENVLDEKGFYKFESEVFSGAAFNIEEVKRISDKVYMVSEHDVLKIFRD